MFLVIDSKILILFSSAINFVLSWIIFRKGKKNKVNLSFSLFALALAYWSLCFYFYFHPIIFSYLIWIKLVYFVTLLIIPSILYFSFYFPQKRIKSFLPLAIIYAVCSLFLIWLLFFTNLWVKEVVVYSWGPQTITGNGYICYFLFVGIIAFLLFYNLLKSYFSSTGIVKTQLKFIFLGIFLFGIPAMIVDVVYPLITGDSRYFWLSPILSLFMVALTTYAITRYRLWDIRIVIGKGMVYIFSFITVIAFAFLLMSLTTQFFATVSFNLSGPLILIVSILLFQPAFRFFEKIAEKYFYYTFYSYQTVLTQLGKELTQVLDLDILTSLITTTLIDTMKLDRTVVLLRDAQTGRYQIKKNIGFKEENGISLVKDNFLTIYLEKTQEPLIYEELSLIIRDTKDKEEKGRLETLKANMKKIEAAACLPLLIERKIIGMIVLGNKIAGEPYSEEDVELLTNLANQTSITLQNAQLYSQVTDLSENLQEKVEEQMKELRRAYSELKKLDEAKSEFISIASHQLRTPLSTIKGYVSMLLEGTYGELSERTKEKLKHVFASNERLIDIVNDLLDISKIELGKMELDKKKVQIEQIIESVYQEMTPEAEKKNLLFVWTKPEIPLPTIEVDELKIRQAFLNIVDNSIKYTKEGKIEIKAKLIDSIIQIAVSDTGEGLTKEEQKEIFEGFIRGAAGINLFIQGSGLGLYVAKKYLSLHNGKIWAESRGKGKGSTFYITLPIKNIDKNI